MTLFVRVLPLDRVETASAPFADYESLQCSAKAPLYPDSWVWRNFRGFDAFALRCELMKSVKGNEIVSTQSRGTRPVNTWLGNISGSSGKPLFEVATHFFSLVCQGPLLVISLGRIFHFWDTWHGFGSVKDLQTSNFSSDCIFV